MNNTFNFNRFGKLLAMDGRKYVRNFGLIFAILCSLNIVLWILTLVFGFPMMTIFRWLICYLGMFLATMLVPSKVFGDINLPSEGVRFAMLPVSNLEKYLSYALFCLATPVLVLLGSWGIDSLLTLLPIGGFDNYIKHWGTLGLMQDFLKELGAASDVDVNMEDAGFEDFQKFTSMFGPAYNINIIIGIVFNVGVFMLGNLLFKTHKIGKTLGLMILFSYVTSMIMQIFFASTGLLPMMYGITPDTQPDINTVTGFVSKIMRLGIIVNSVFTVGIYVGIFFKLKTQKY